MLLGQCQWEGQSGPAHQTGADGIIDQINVFARLGMPDAGKWLDYHPCNNWKADLDRNFVWAVGAKGKIYEFANGLGFGLGAQYMRYDDRKVKNWRSLERGITKKFIAVIAAVALLSVVGCSEDTGTMPGTGKVGWVIGWGVGSALEKINQD